MSKFKKTLEETTSIPTMNTSNRDSIKPEYVARMRLQNQFKTGIDIAKYTYCVCKQLF